MRSARKRKITSWTRLKQIWLRWLKGMLTLPEHAPSDCAYLLSSSPPWSLLRESTDQRLVTLVLFTVSRTYSFLFPGTLGHYYVEESLWARSLRGLGILSERNRMAKSPNRMRRTLTWAGILSLLGIEKGPAQDAPARSEEILLQSQKMEAIGRLAGGIAHDFNNLLAVITGYSDLLLESPASDLDRRKVEQIKQAANSAASLIRQLLMFSRQQVVQHTVLDLNQAVGGTEKMLRRLIRENIEFTVMLDPHLVRVKADSGQIEQLVLNLVVNARDAMPNGGKLRIQTKNVRLKKDAQSEAGVPSDHFVLLEVTDTGIGMDQETQARIFEPFFTTKEVGKGTGLGLATVYAIVQQSSGSIEVQQHVGSRLVFQDLSSCGGAGRRRL